MPSTLQDIQVFLQGRSLLDVVDVLIVAFLLYWVINLIRGTQALQIALGIGLLAALGFAAETLHLVLLSFIFEKIGPALLILLLILFQPELRRALEQVGRFSLVSRPMGRTDLEVLNRTVAETTRAATHLSERHQGALIVFERSVGVSDYAASGVRVTGRVKAELLESIFFPGGPLHDGAVVVRRGEIIAASCVLPLPEDFAIRERLGTRHRAALGLSLHCDAVVLVVSEETGSISLVHGGRIDRDLTPDRLRRQLAALLLPGARRPSLVDRFRRTSTPGRTPQPENAEVAASENRPPVELVK